MDAEEITLREEVALMPQELAYGVTSIQTEGDLTLVITTLEGETLRISASVAGYRIDLSTKQELVGKSYETMQALMLAISPAFGDAFQEQVTLKLLGHLQKRPPILSE